MTQTTLELNLTVLHPKQQEIAHHPAKHKVVCAGRRAGKSKLCCSHAIFRAIAYREPVWWVAPTFRNTKAAWRELVTLVEPIRRTVNVYKDDFLIEIKGGGGFVQVVSAAEPDNMRSVGLGGYIFDEAAYGEARVHTEVLLPALLDFDGWSMLISTPNGFNWFHQEFQRGIAGEQDHASFHFTTYDNPHLKKSAIDALRANMTEKAWRQEIMAEFVADALSVFRNIAGCVYHEPEAEPLAGHDYVIGVDWGRKHDHTALSVWNVTERREVALDRFSQVGFGIQSGRIRALVDHWQPTLVIAEENGIGMANVERLQDMGIPMEAFKMSMQSKKLVVEEFALALERGEAGITDHAVGNGELQAYQENVTVKGNIQYSAPDGGHDDTVVARMLAWHTMAEAIGDPFILDW